ncbi:protein of unknown function [Aminobacter niigataensis]|nr:protein of unknown function [Aminobacter niigataensis]
MFFERPGRQAEKRSRFLGAQKAWRQAGVSTIHRGISITFVKAAEIERRTWAMMEKGSGVVQVRNGWSLFRTDRHIAPGLCQRHSGVAAPEA